MMFGAVVALVVLDLCPGKTELVLGCPVSEPPESHVNGLELYLDKGIVGHFRCS